MWKSLALVAICCAVVGSQFAQADVGKSTTEPQATASTPCTPIKQVYSEKNWRDAKPVDGRRLCPVRRRAGKQNTVEHFYLYRTYRRISPFRGTGGDLWLQWSPIPTYILACEGGAWDSHNPSGADGPAQMMAAVDVNSRSSARTKVTYWQEVSHLWDGGRGASNWACA